MNKAVIGVFALVMAIGATASAAPILITKDLPGNVKAGDCPGFFGPNDQSCDIGYPLGTEISKMIVKLNFDDGDPGEINKGSYGSITGAEFTVNMTDPWLIGSWSYVAGTGDPGVRFWSTKGGGPSNDVRLHWFIDDANAGLCAGDPFNIACLNAALTVTSGTWSVAGRNAMSHITFFNGSTTTVPEPATVLLLGTGLAAAALRRRRK